MTDEQIEDMLEYCPGIRKEDALALIKRQEAEIRRLEYTLLGVMHNVDKWLEGDELKQDEVNRAITMREKTLRIVESLQVEAEWVLEGLLNPKCSACNWSAYGTSRYCPHCGAKMK